MIHLRRTHNRESGETRDVCYESQWGGPSGYHGYWVCFRDVSGRTCVAMDFNWQGPKAADGTPTVLRNTCMFLCDNNEDWRGQDYAGRPIDMDLIRELTYVEGQVVAAHERKTRKRKRDGEFCEKQEALGMLEGVEDL